MEHSFNKQPMAQLNPTLQKKKDGMKLSRKYILGNQIKFNKEQLGSPWRSGTGTNQLWRKGKKKKKREFGARFHYGLLNPKMGKSLEVVGIEVEGRMVETEPVFDDLSSKSSRDPLSFGGHSSKNR